MSTIANQVLASAASEPRTQTRFVLDQGAVQALAASVSISKLDSPELSEVSTVERQLSELIRSPTQGSSIEGDSISLSDFPHPPQNELARIQKLESPQDPQSPIPAPLVSGLSMIPLQPPSIQGNDSEEGGRRINPLEVGLGLLVEAVRPGGRMATVRLRRERGESESSETEDPTYATQGARVKAGVENDQCQMKALSVFQKDNTTIHDAGMAPTSKPRTESKNVAHAPRTTERSYAVMEEAEIMPAPRLMKASYAIDSASGSTSVIRASRAMEGCESSVAHVPRTVERRYSMMHGEKFVPIASSQSKVVTSAPRTNEIDHDEMDEQDHLWSTHLMEWLRITTSGQTQNLRPIKCATSEDDDITRAPRMTEGSYAHTSCSNPISASTLERALTISDDAVGSTWLCPPPPPTLRTMDEPTTKLLAKKLRKVGESAQARRMLREQAKQTAEQAAASGAQSPKRRSFTDLVSSASRSDLGSKFAGMFHMRRRSKSGDSSSSSTSSISVITPEAHRGSFTRPSMEFSK